MYIENINPDEVVLEEEEEGRANLLPQKLSKMKNADHHSHKSRLNKCVCQNAFIWESSVLDLE